MTKKARKKKENQLKHLENNHHLKKFKNLKKDKRDFRLPKSLNTL